MQSPTKNYAKKTGRKSVGTFSQPAAQTEVGDFKGGYFVSSSPAVNKDTNNTDTSSLKRSTTLKQEHDTSNLKRNNNVKQERSPGRRKHQANESTAALDSYPSPSKDHQSKEENFRRHSISTCVDTPTKMYNPESPKKRSSTILSTSPPTPSTRWAGPAFGNAPPPSSLPLPDWTPVTSPSPPHSHASYQVHHGMTFSPLSSSPPQYQHPLSYSPIPAVPFPYIHSAPVPVHSAPGTPLHADAPSLAQLSTDLRRLLNIGAGFDPILVSANSS